MSLGINTNIASLSAQRALANSQSDAATAMQRLSTGLRINSAKDDAAGLAISNRLTTQISGMAVATRNANDAISLLQTAEGGLQSITDNLLRIRELAVQANSDQVGATERGYLNKEVEQLRAEIDRVAEGTKFGDTQILKGGTNAGDAKSFQFHIGHGADVASSTGVDRLDISIKDFNSASLGATQAGTNDWQASVTGTVISGVVTAADDATIQVGTNASVDIGQASISADKNLAAQYVTAINAVSGVSATVGQSKLDVTVGAYGESTGADSTFNVEIKHGANTSTYEIAAAGDGDQNAAAIKAALTTFVGSSETTGLGGIAWDGTSELTASDGRDLQIKFYTATAGTDGNGGASDATYAGGQTNANNGKGDLAAVLGSHSETGHGTVNVTSDADYKGEAKVTFTGDEIAKTGLVTTDASGGTTAPTSGTQINAVSVTNITNATAAIQAVDEALNTVNLGRAELGSYQARFESVVDNLNVASENTVAARSRVLDADFAVESAALAKTQVLQQAGISVLAQANAMPQQVLALLQ